MLYVPEVYSDYCRESVLVMERIYGIPVSDIATLEQQGTNMKLLAERGVQVFFTRYSATASSMRTCIPVIFSSATNIRKILAISASTAASSAR